MDSYFWSTANDGDGSTLDAQYLQGYTSSQILGGVENGIMCWYYGTFADFTDGKLNGHPNWCLCNGTNGTENVADTFIVGASVPGYQVGTSVGNATFVPVGTPTIANHVLTLAETMHTHPITDSVPNFGCGTDYPGYADTVLVGYVNNNGAVTASAGSGNPHTHAATFAGKVSSLLPPYYCLVQIQFVGT